MSVEAKPTSTSPKFSLRFVLVLGGVMVVAAAGWIAATATASPPVTVTAEAQLLNDKGSPVDPESVPFTIEAANPGEITEGGTVVHQILITGTDGDVELDDPRFSGVATTNGGQLVVAGPTCAPHQGDEGVTIGCADVLNPLRVSEGRTSVVEVTIHTDDEVGHQLLAPGEYIIDTPISWSSPGQHDYTKGVVARITYNVEPQ